MSISISNLGHVFATALHDLKTITTNVLNFAEQHQVQIHEGLKIAEGITALTPLGPIVQVIDRAEEASYGVLHAALADANHAVINNGDGTLTFSVIAAEAVYNDLRAFMPIVEAALHPGSPSAAASLKK